MKKESSGIIWPYAIGISIILVIFASYYTVKVALEHPVEQSNLFMRNYHDADANINQIIMDEIEFNKNYRATLVESDMNMKNTTVAFRIMTKDATMFNDAKIQLILTRPQNDKSDIKPINPIVKDGLYTFSNIELSHEGRWDIMAKITAGKYYRYLDYKVDTRNSKVVEY
ncbi:MAG: FixH family protein [Campylobacterota bacterium]|nr:FixH family protein [Campylobacterota bacterium]